MIRIALLLFITLLLPELKASPLPRHCNSSTVRELTLPISDKTPNETFTYRFNLSERENKDAPVIIFIPGGPGETSMNMGLSYPYEFAVVRTDPRGMGCNENSLIPVESFTSQNIARDILAVIKELKPKTYFIHGISYGTMVATILASLIEKENLPAPKAVVLEGTIGRAYAPDEYMKGTLERWKIVKKKLPLKLQQSLSKKIPFDYSSKEFAAWLSAILIFGELPTGDDYAVDELLILDSKDNDLKESLKIRIKNMTRPPTEAKIRHYKEIACREFVPDVRDVKYDYEFKTGELVPTSERLCKGIEFTRPFDSKEFQIKPPVYYFSGSLDPVTPPSQAKYHFEGQSGERTMIRVINGGHTALSTNLSDCFSVLWLSMIDGNQSSFGKLLKDKCSLKTEVETR